MSFEIDLGLQGIGDVLNSVRVCLNGYNVTRRKDALIRLVVLVPFR